MWYYFSFANLNTPLIKKITLPYINHVQSIILVLINYLGSRVENVKQMMGCGDLNYKALYLGALIIVCSPIKGPVRTMSWPCPRVVQVALFGPLARHGQKSIISCGTHGQHVYLFHVSSTVTKPSVLFCWIFKYLI